MKKLAKTQRSYSFTEYVITFEDESGGQEDQTITVSNEPSMEWIKEFMDTFGFTIATVKEVATEVSKYGIEYED